MSDRSTVYFHLYACPEDQRAAAAAALDAEDLYFEFENDAVAAAGQLSLTRPYFAEEYPVGSLGDCARAVREAAPGCSYVAWEEPGTTGPGEIHAYTPVLGLFTAASAGQGEAFFTLPEATAAIWGTGRPGRLRRLLPARRSRVAARLHHAMGGPWMDDWESCRDAALRAAGTGGLTVQCASGTPRQYAWEQGDGQASGTLADYAEAFTRVKDASLPDTGIGTELRDGTQIYPVVAEGLATTPDEDGYWPVRLSVPGEEVTVRVWG